MADDPLASRAAFAERFKNTTNLDQRRRFAQDISEARNREEERDQADFERMQLANPEVGRLVLAREKADQAARNQFAVRDLAERRFQWDQEKASRLEAINAKRMDLQMRQEDRLLKKAEMEMDRENRMEEDTLAVEDEEQRLRESGVLPGSAAYKQGMVDIFLKRPYVDKQYRNMALEAAGIQDPEAAFEAAANAIQAGASRASAKLPGGGTATFTSPKETKQEDVKIDTARLDRIKKERSKLLGIKSPTEGEKDLLGYYDNEIAAIDKQRQSAAPQPTSAPPAAQAAASSHPANRPPLADIFK